MRIVKGLCLVVFLAVFLQAVYVRYSLIGWRPINVDEPFFWQNAYRLMDGQKPYVDYFEPKVPLLHYLMLPAIRAVFEPTQVYILLRTANLLMIVISSALLFAMLFRHFGAIPATFALAVWNSFTYFVSRPDFRLNNPMHMFILASCWLLLEGIAKRRRLMVALGGAVFGFALLTKQIALLFFVAAALFVALYHAFGRGDGRAGRAIADLLAFGLAAFATFWLSFWLMLGTDAIDGFVRMLKTFLLFGMHERLTAHSHHTALYVRNTLVPNALAWAAVALSIAYANYLVFVRRRAHPLFLMLTVLADFSILYLFLRGSIFEQTFFHAFLFGSALCAGVLWHLASKSRNKAAVYAIGLMAVAASQAMFWPDFTRRVRAMRMGIEGNEQVFARATDLDANGFFKSADAARKWFQTNYWPYHAAYEAIDLPRSFERMRLVESVAGFNTYSLSYANYELFPRQPFGLFYYDFAKIALELKRTDEHGRHCDTIRYYNPLVCWDGADFEEKVVMWLEAYEPEVLVLDEDFGRDMFAYDGLFEFMKNNYRFYLCRRCMALVAVRNDLVDRIANGAR